MSAPIIAGSFATLGFLAILAGRKAARTSTAGARDTSGETIAGIIQGTDALQDFCTLPPLPVQEPPPAPAENLGRTQMQPGSPRRAFMPGMRQRRAPAPQTGAKKLEAQLIYLMENAGNRDLKPQIEQAKQTALDLGLVRLATLIKSGGYRLSPRDLPLNENWPGTAVSMREYIAPIIAHRESARERGRPVLS